ncbi:MAG: hypothetical protein H0X02_08655 [Nitrosomonas sp.]|nr:hypothetical protein [Nitrosomonas sp.]
MSRWLKSTRLDGLRGRQQWLGRKIDGPANAGLISRREELVKGGLATRGQLT